MSRTTRYKLLYVLVLLGVGGAVLYLLALSGLPTSAYFIVALILLFPSRVNGHYWRDCVLAETANLALTESWFTDRPVFTTKLQRRGIWKTDYLVKSKALVGHHL